MDSPVVVAAAEACAGRGLATLRFNFRGVGASAGAWDEGRGERDDVRAALADLRRRLAPRPASPWPATRSAPPWRLPWPRTASRWPGSP